ncbi:hypothetical protein DMENIID0001_152320 [Sergentomyia squamirostris]
MDLTKLNDDCLYLILSKLSVRELINAELVCKRFHSIIQKVYCGRRILDFNEECAALPEYHLSKAEMMLINSKVGKHIDTLIVSECLFEKKFLKNINDLLSAKVNDATRVLKNLSVEGFNINKSALDTNFFVRIFSKLKTVRLVDCYWLNDSLLSKCLQDATELEILNLSGSCDVGACVQFIRNIKELNLTFVGFSQNDDILKLCENNKATLTSLKICMSRRNEPIWFNEIVRNLRSLKELSLFPDTLDEDLESEETVKEVADRYATLGDLPYLTTLKIVLDDDSLIMNQMLEKLVQRNILESLKLRVYKESNHENWKKEAAENVTKFRNLRTLKYSWKDMTDSHLKKFSSKASLVIADFGCAGISSKGALDFINQCPNLQKISVPCLLFEDLQNLQQRSECLDIFVDKLKYPNIADQGVLHS